MASLPIDRNDAPDLKVRRYPTAFPPRKARPMLPAPVQPVRRIGVFRALQLGDLLCAVPALRALRCAHPDARITLIGLPSSAEFARRFRHYVDDWLDFPGAHALPEQPVRAELLPSFFAAARARRFDLALQLHGSGERTNGIVRLFGARRTCGFSPGGSELGGSNDFVRWPTEGSEIERLLCVVDHLGIERQGSELEFPIDDDERRAWQRLSRAHSLDAQRLVLVHPGARFPSRRWRVERFAELADRLVLNGWQVAITGTPDEADLSSSMVRAMRVPVANLCGQTGLGELGAAIEASRLVVCNDTGVSHMAVAVGTRSVIVASGSEIRRWRPLDRSLHPMVALDLPCRPCSDPVCPIEGHPCASGIGVDRVFELAMHHLTTSSLAHEHA